MIHSILKRSLTAMLIMLLGNITIYAANDDFATQQITIKLDEAGTLPNKIGSSQKYKITNLKIIGDINGTDISMIRGMEKLSTLDLSETRIVKGGDAYYHEKDGWGVYTSPNKIGEYTFCHCSKLTTVTLPTTVTELGYSAFEGCTGLTSIDIPESVTNIGNSAFEGCTGLTSINIPKNVTNIGSSAFEGCTGLTSINIPEGVTEIYRSIFQDCTGLTSINIPEGVTEIGASAFNGCTGLTSIYSYGITPASVVYGSFNRTDDTFKGIDKKSCTLYVPTGSYQDYWLADGWGDFENIVEFDPTGINYTTTQPETTEASRYTLDGQKLNAPSKGMNIVKYSDGTVKKVVVK